MPTGRNCPTCGRQGAGKSNLITNLDELTQSIYLTEDGYLLRNPHWHMGMSPMMPEPEDMEEFMEDLHKEVTPTAKGSFPEYQTQYFRLYQFRFIWFSSTQTILCRLPYAGRNWFEQATFFLPPANELEPNFNNLNISLQTRWTGLAMPLTKKPKNTREKRLFIVMNQNPLIIFCNQMKSY